MQALLQIGMPLLFIILRKTYSIFEGLIDYFEESAFKSRIKKPSKILKSKNSQSKNQMENLKSQMSPVLWFSISDLWFHLELVVIKKIKELVENLKSQMSPVPWSLSK
jgi:hypothetical protein